MRFVDLFCGIGGFRLGMEAAGHTCVGACEIDPYARAVYLKNYPDTTWFPDDITKIQPADIPEAECWTGGFPCQDLSIAGNRAGLSGESSGLFYEIIRLASVVRPRYIFMENVPALLFMGMGAVLGELSEIGSDAEWEVVSASDVGLPHQRERVWIVAYTQGMRRHNRNIKVYQHPQIRTEGRSRFFTEIDFSHYSPHPEWPGDLGDVRICDGVSDWMDTSRRVHALGNAVVPEVVERIARTILTEVT